jgi:hypothetical protein
MSHIRVDDIHLGSFCHSFQNECSSRMGKEGLMMSKYLRDKGQNGTALNWQVCLQLDNMRGQQSEYVLHDLTLSYAWALGGLQTFPQS